ncbi:MAG: hypothetical protein AVDCRST_MAG89-614, partial [uncultured Gemmatimonadetes bacterium]
ACRHCGGAGGDRHQLASDAGRVDDRVLRQAQPVLRPRPRRLALPAPRVREPFRRRHRARI